MKEQYQKEMSLSRGLAKQLAQTQRRLNKAERELKNVQNKAERALKLSLKAEKRAKLMAKEVFVYLWQSEFVNILESSWPS